MRVIDGGAETSAQRETDAQDASAPSDLAMASLEALMSAYVDGSAAAFEALYEQLSPRVFGYLLSLTRQRERAEDLLQVTFAKVHRARTSYLRGNSVVPWVLAIARRSFFDDVRAQKARPEDLSHDGTLPEPQRLAGPDEDLGEALERAMNDLPRAYREAIELTKVLGLTMVEAADVSGTTPAAMKLRVHRGYKALRAALEASGHV